MTQEKEISGSREFASGYIMLKTALGLIIPATSISADHFTSLGSLLSKMTNLEVPKPLNGL